MQLIQLLDISGYFNFSLQDQNTAASKMMEAAPALVRQRLGFLASTTLGFCYSPVNFHAHSCVSLRSLPLTPTPIRAHSSTYPGSLLRLSALPPAQAHSLPHMLMDEYLQENDKNPILKSIVMMPTYASGLADRTELYIFSSWRSQWWNS